MNYHARRFDRAAGSYRAHAAFQERMAGRLMGLLPAGPPFDGPIVEFGCGTGLLTRELARRFPGVPLLATDAAPRMLSEAERALSGIRELRLEICDASGQVPPPPGVEASLPYGLAASNAVVQWFPDLGGHLAWARSLLAPGGLYLVSGFDRGNFPELNALLREPPFGYSDFPGHSASDLPALAEAAGLLPVALETESREEVFPSPRALLDSIRALGAARRPREDRPMTRSRLERLVATYQERYPREGGVAATWKPWYALFRKPA